MYMHNRKKCNFHHIIIYFVMEMTFLNHISLAKANFIASFLCILNTQNNAIKKLACRFPHIQTRNSPALWARIQILFPWTCGSERIQQRWDTILSVGNDLCVCARIRVNFRPPAV